MRDFILLMHKDTTAAPSPEMWSSYFSLLRGRGVFEGGSSIGAGEAFRKQGTPGNASAHLAGYIRVRAKSLADAEDLLAGNPVFECGGTVEIRELPRE
jgi:hypothetical protein